MTVGQLNPVPAAITGTPSTSPTGSRFSAIGAHRGDRRRHGGRRGRRACGDTGTPFPRSRSGDGSAACAQATEPSSIRIECRKTTEREQANVATRTCANRLVRRIGGRPQQTSFAPRICGKVVRIPFTPSRCLKPREGLGCEYVHAKNARNRRAGE